MQIFGDYTTDVQFGTGALDIRWSFFIRADTQKL